MSGEVILMRHAQAESSLVSGSDLSRALTAVGLADAARAGRWLAAHGLQPARIVCSPATRAVQTARGLDLQPAETGILEDPRIYEASTAALLDVIAANSDAAAPWLLVGHNPGLESLLASMLPGSSPLVHDMPPGACAWLQLLDVADPDAPNRARLLRHWQP